MVRATRTRASLANSWESSQEFSPKKDRESSQDFSPEDSREKSWEAQAALLGRGRPGRSTSRFSQFSRGGDDDSTQPNIGGFVATRTSDR